MATPDGTVRFTVGDAAYTLRYDINVLCQIEDALGIEDIRQLQTTLKDKLSFRKLRTLFCKGLSPQVGEEQAGVIIQSLGVSAAATMMGEAFQAAFPSEGGEGEAAENPPKAAAGTGSTS